MAPKKGSPKAAKANAEPGNIAFRFRHLEAECAQELARRAADLGISANDLAREYVLERLQNAVPLAVWMREFQTIQAYCRILHQDLALGVEALLAKAGKVTEQDSRVWVKDNYTIK